MTVLKNRLLGVKVEDIIYESFEDLAWREHKTKSELLRTLIRETLEKRGIKVKEMQIGEIRKDK